MNEELAPQVNTTPSVNPIQTQPSHTSKLVVILSGLVILFIIIGSVVALSFNNLLPFQLPGQVSNLTNKTQPTPEENAPSATDTQTEALSKVGTGDSVAAIEEDINTTDLSDLDREINAINSELSGL